MSAPVTAVIAGTHLVETVLCHGRTPAEAITVVRGGSSRGLARVVTLAEEKGVPVQWVDADGMTELTGNSSVDVALTPAERESLTLEDALPEDDTSALLLVIEGVEDPHNFGEILRTAWAAGVQSVVIEMHAKAMPRNVLARCSAGASECLPLIFTDNLVGALETLTAHALETIAAMPNATETLFDAAFSRRVAVVIGGERRGLSRHVVDTCTRQVTIATVDAMQSLSAASSAAVMLFEMTRRRGERAGV